MPSQSCSVSNLLVGTQYRDSCSLLYQWLDFVDIFCLQDQNIRFPVDNDDFVGLKRRSEDQVKLTEVIAPIFASISREAWDTAKFPSTNWYSDNIICHDLQKAGFQHFVSRAYVHHVGSQTVGTDFQKCHEEPREWIKANRPDMYEEIYGKTP